jgi:TP901 family phage tail tape measure protein
MAGLRAKVVLSVDTAQAKRSTERAAAEMNRVMGGVGKRQVNFNVNSKSFTQPLGRITGSANEFTKSLEASNARVIAFGASVGIINAISDAFKNLVGETVRFEKTLTDINVVLNQSNSAMQQFGQGLFDVARNTAQSFNVASEAALEFSRQGLTMEEVLKRTNDALTLTRLTGLKAAEAVSGLTAAVNAFSSVGLTTTEVIDKLAAVDVKFAVSSEDLINALERTGAVAIDAGVELDSLIGLVTSLQQTTARGGAVIGNGLKTIFTRIQRPAALSQIEDLDIAVRNMSGAILPADKILINIAKSFDRLTSSQQSNIVQFSAGIFQANVFRASLRDLAKDQSIQARATEVSASAAGEAAMKNKQLNKTISALASQTGSDIQELATLLGELMVKPELGSYLETFRDVIGGIKNMLGGGEDEGSTFAKGLVAGIGNIITGPAFIAFGAIFIKLFMNIAKFAKGSMKDVMNIVDRKTKVEQIEKSIVDTLAKNKDIQTSLNNLEGDREAQSKFILKIIEAQTNAMREQEKLASRLARPLLDAGVKSDLTVSGNGRVDLDGDGRTDSFGAGGVVPQSARKERKEASRGGYSAGAVDSMSIKGLGRVVYNKAETVKQFPGMQQPAIMPPQKSRAGSKYKDAFSTKHGFDPYASGGFVPNFADLYNTGGQLADGGTGYFKTPLDLIERSLPRVGDLGGTEKYTTERRLRERQKQHLGAGRSREELLGEAHRFIYRYNTNDQVLDDLLTGDYTSLRGDVKFNKFLKSSSGISAGRLLAAGRPIARDLGYAYEVPTKGLDVGGYHPESQLRDSVGLENAEQTYPTTKFLSQLNFARDFFGGENEAQKKLLSKGFVPNFATLNGDALRLNQSKMHLYANPREAKPGGDAVRNAMMELVNSGKPVTVRAATDKLLKGEGGSHTKAIKGLIRFIADQENGPKLFERDFKLTNLPWKGNKGEDASEDAVAQALNKGGNKYINTGKRPGAHGDKTFPVDLIGEGLDPVEVKSGEWQQPNILLKSMRLYSDDELMQFAERQYGATPEMLTGARMENLGKSARLLQGKGLLDKDASLEDQHNAALKYGIAGGFVPNFEEGTPTYKGKGARREALRLLEGVVKQAGGRSPEELEALPSIGELAKPEDNPLIFGGDSRKTLSEIINNSSHGRRASGTNVPITGAGDAFTRPLSEGGK